MRAIVLAGGRGTRLGPLTRHLPKPLVPFFDRPILEHQIQWLARNGFDDIVVALGHLGHMIESAMGPERYGARLSYVSEERPLGTAGAVAWALRQYPSTEPVLVVPGDCLADYDLAAVYRNVVEQAAEVGMVLSQVEDPRPFGVVSTNVVGRVLRLIEKPATHEFGHLVNTGIYVLHPDAVQDIPVGATIDFAQEVFPAWIRSGRVVHGYESAGYWSDVGSLTQYQQTQMDVLNGRLRLPLADQPSVNVRIDRTARIIEPVWCGDNVTVEAHATLGPYATIGSGSRVGAWAKVDHTIIGTKTVIGVSSRVQGALLADRVELDGRSRVGARAVLGAGCQVGWGGHVPTGARLAPRERVAPGCTWEKSGSWPEGRPLRGVSV
ncbi:MAG: NDP-sugar synthase [Thermaerobacter sp.]|nr:NDP-sugar synthase [Thermaerobacter sp.]